MTSPLTNPLIAAGLTEEVFARLSADYRRLCEADVYAVDAEGVVVLGRDACRQCETEECRQTRLHAIMGTMQWGEATVSFCAGNRLIWAVPVTINEKVAGGLVASLPEAEAFAKEGDGDRRDFRALCQSLRLLAERENLTNSSHLELRRLRYAGEQTKAYAIHAYKTADHNSLRRLYLREEPALFAAIRAGDRGAAREIINRILVALHHHAGSRISLLKSVFLELIVVMSRTAVEAGGSPEELLGTNFNSMAALSNLQTEAEISMWLVTTLEHLIDSIERAKAEDPGVLVTAAISYIQQNASRPIQRDDVADAVGVSPSHFSFLIRKETGETFTDLINQVRVDKAADLLRRTDWSLAAIANQCGFRDQSYFTKVFKKYRKQTPLRYRKQT